MKKKHESFRRRYYNEKVIHFAIFCFVRLLTEVLNFHISANRTKQKLKKNIKVGTTDRPQKK